ncbi:Ribosome maturation factor RimP, partial [Linum perenne]
PIYFISKTSHYSSLSRFENYPSFSHPRSRKFEATATEMESVSLRNVRVSSAFSIPPISLVNRNFSFSFPTLTCRPFQASRNKLCVAVQAKKKSRELPPQEEEPVIESSILEEVLSDDEDDGEVEGEEQLLFDDDEFDEDLIDDDFEDEFEEEDEPKLQAGDGAGGGGIALAGTWWDKEALAIAEQVCLSFDGELGIYAFKTLLNGIIRVRIERLTNKSGSPNMEDVEAFSRTYRARLDEAELAKAIPEQTTLEVSSPGVERVVRIPEDLDRFKERPMYVKYVSEAVGTESASESDGVFRLVSFDLEMKCCTWGIADVRFNREKSGKGRPLNKKQREWRLNTPFESLSLVRIHSEC